MRLRFPGSRTLRTVVALTFVFLPLRPIYGAGQGPGCDSSHHVAPAAHQHAPAPHDYPAAGNEDYRHSHSASRQIDPAYSSSAAPAAVFLSADNPSCTGPYCDGNCISCTSGAVLSLPLTIAGNASLSWRQAVTPAYLEVILPLPTHPPKSFSI